MTAVEPIDEENPTLADIARGLNLVHSCLDSHRDEQTVRWAEQKKFNGGVTRGLVEVERQLGALTTQQEVDGGRITRLARAFGTEQLAPGEKADKVKTIAGWRGWQIGVAIFGSVSGALALFKIFVPALIHFGPPMLRDIYHAILAAQ